MGSDFPWGGLKIGHSTAICAIGASFHRRCPWPGSRGVLGASRGVLTAGLPGQNWLNGQNSSFGMEGLTKPTSTVVPMAHYAEAFAVTPGQCFRFAHSGVGHAAHCREPVVCRGWFI